MTEGASKTVTVTYAPTSNGLFVGTMKVHHNALGETTNVVVRGTGLPGPSVRVSTASLDIGNVDVGDSDGDKFLIINDGKATLSVTSVTSSDSAMFTVLSPTESFDLDPGTGEWIRMRFTPPSEGTKSGTSSIAHNAAGGSTEVPITGIGVAPAAGDATMTVTFTPSQPTAGQAIQVSTHIVSPSDVVSVSVNWRMGGIGV